MMKIKTQIKKLFSNKSGRYIHYKLKQEKEILNWCKEYLKNHPEYEKPSYLIICICKNIILPKCKNNNCNNFLTYTQYLNKKQYCSKKCINYFEINQKIQNDIIIEILLQKMYDAIANKELEVIMEKVRTTLKFAPEDYKIMRLDRRLAKCLANRIIINPDIVRYRKEIIEYVVFYEFCRLKINKTSKKFYDMLRQYMPNYEKYEFELVGVNY